MAKLMSINVDNGEIETFDKMSDMFDEVMRVHNLDYYTKVVGSALLYSNESKLTFLRIRKDHK